MHGSDTLAGTLERWAVDLMELLGGAGAGLLIALEQLFPPVPSELVLPLAGFAVSRGILSFTGAIAWTTGGSVIGALALYWVGARVGRDRVIRIADRLPLVEVADIIRAERWFERHGSRAVLLGRMVPLVRSLVSIPAGVGRMHLGVFVGYTIVGSLAWNTLLIGAGYLLAARWALVAAYVGAYSRAVVFAAILLLAAVAARRAVTGRRRPIPMEDR